MTIIGFFLRETKWKGVVIIFHGTYAIYD